MSLVELRSAAAARQWSGSNPSQHCVRVSVTGVPFDLADIKLGAPSIRPGTVAKEDVIARLSTARVPVVTVVAPAGYGKTTSSRVGPRPIRVRLRVMLDARGQRRRRVPALHRSRDSPSRAADLARGVRRAVRPRGIHSGRSASRVSCSGRTRASLGACPRRSAPRRQSFLFDVLAESSSTAPFADRDREQGGAGTAACPLADKRAGQGDRRGGPPARRAGGCAATGAAGVELDGGELVDLDRADGRLACRPVPRGAVDADGWRPAGWRASRATIAPVRVSPR